MLNKGSIVTIGNFDGVHIAHQEIISNMKKKSNNELPIIAITFNPHPKKIINNMIEYHYLTPIKHKIQLLKKNGIDKVHVVDFDNNISKISHYEFLKEVIVRKFNPRFIVLGRNHEFGYKRLGNIHFLKENEKKYNFKTIVVEPVMINNIAVSSTNIRKYILDGKIEYANKLLGKMYEIEGTVVSGSKRGKNMNFPTANIQICDYLVPGNGSYCISSYINDISYNGMCNICIRPTFYNSGEQSVEVHLLTDEIVDCYDEKVSVSFKSYLREERKYNSKDKLIEQLLIDREVCFNI